MGLAVAGITMILVGCGETSSPTAIPVVTTGSNTPTSTTAPTNVAPGTDGPPVTQAARPMATPSPLVIERVDATPAPQPGDSQRQVQDLVFYDQDGLVLEFYWPLDEGRGLSADETEILAYNTGSQTIEFQSPSISFMEGGAAKSQSSGTWEKFPSAASWDRIEYIQIPPSPPTGESLLVLPGEKAKLHWHMEGVTAADTDQSVAVNLTVLTAGGAERITQTLTRGGGEQAHASPVVKATPSFQPTPAPTAGHESQSGSASGESRPIWRFDGTEWTPNGTAPSCAEPLGLQTPVDMSIVTSALWPGQSRGGYKGHGGFRFDSTPADGITVRAPIGAHLVQASKYLEGDEEQILLFFSAPCGFFYRFDHVAGLSPQIDEALQVITGPVTTSSRTTFMSPPLWVEKGEVVGTSVGIPPSNIFVDFGLYDVRKPNNVIPNPAWADSFAQDKEFGHYGVCFFDYLPGDDGDTMRSLPTGKEGQTSDYCD